MWCMWISSNWICKRRIRHSLLGTFYSVNYFLHLWILQELFVGFGGWLFRLLLVRLVTSRPLYVMGGLPLWEVGCAGAGVLFEPTFTALGFVLCQYPQPRIYFWKFVLLDMAYFPTKYIPFRATFVFFAPKMHFAIIFFLAKGLLASQ